MRVAKMKKLDFDSAEPYLVVVVIGDERKLAFLSMGVVDSSS